MATVRMWSGREARALREALRLSVRSFAAYLGVNERTVTKWEAGGISVRPRPEMQAALDTALEQASDEAAARFETAIMAGQPPAKNCDLPALGRSAALQDAAEAVNTAAHESTELLAWIEIENVGELTLEQLHSEVRRISHAYLKAPTLPLFRRTCQLRDRAFTLLDGRHRPGRARDLYAAAGWSLTVLAWMSVDLGRPDAGEDHARTAWLCAERAEHDGLRAWVRATQHTAAFWQDDFGRAAQYAADGSRYATGSAALFLASAYALDLARSGQDEPAWEALRQAQQCAETVEQSGDALAGPFTCGFDRANGFWSDTQLALGVAHAALDEANRAVAAFEAQPLEQRNQGSERMARLQQVRGHMALGQLHDAEEALMPILDTAPEHRMRPLLVRMNDVYTSAAKPEHRHESIAKRIRDATTTFQQDTAIKDTKEMPA